MFRDMTKLEEQAHQYLQEEKFAEAEQLFAQLYLKDKNKATLNNLALAKFKQGKLDEALEVLQENLKPVDGYSPFARALAAEILINLDRVGEAKRQVNQAIIDFEKGLLRLKREGEKNLKPWFEYTVSIMRAAGFTGDHRLVLDLYKRWQKYHVSFHNKFYAGVAAFNRERFIQAASYWDSIQKDYATNYSLVARMCERGVVPPFSLEYTGHELDTDLIAQMETKEERSAYMTKGYVRMSILQLVLHPEHNLEGAKAAVRFLITYGGEWGKQLGLEFLETSVVSDALKVPAAQELLALGVLEKGKPISMYIDGKHRLVEVMQKEVISGQNKDLDVLFERAKKLQAQGRIEDAIELMEKLYLDGIVYPPTAVMLANLYRTQGRLNEARTIFEMLEKVSPDEPSLLFNLCGLWLQLDNVNKAKEYLDQLKRRELNDEWQKRIQFAEEEIVRYNQMTKFTSMFQLSRKEGRKQVEAKPLKDPVTLNKGLKNMPAAWLNVVCEQWGLEPARLRKDREQQIVEFLSDPQLSERFKDLSEKEIDAFHYLLEKDGWVRLSTMNRMFGSMDDDDWEYSLPTSTLGLLWSKALVIVGTVSHNNRRIKIAAVPIEIRESIIGEDS